MQSQHILPPRYLFVAIVLMLALHWIVPIEIWIAWPYTLLGIIPLGLGSWLNLAADSALKQNHTTVKPFEASTALVTTGVYRLSRHPMYLGMVLILLGLAILLGSLVSLPIVIVFAVLLDWVFIRSEEAMLRDGFGEAWRDYSGQVRRWI
ncbi:MAG: isoprenylcysteine carboxylmethyltransferase family protein [Gammaproteobacteria bacterium]